MPLKGSTPLRRRLLNISRSMPCFCPYPREKSAKPGDFRSRPHASPLRIALAQRHSLERFARSPHRSVFLHSTIYGIARRAIPRDGKLPFHRLSRAFGAKCAPPRKPLLIAFHRALHTAPSPVASLCAFWQSVFRSFAFKSSFLPRRV